MSSVAALAERPAAPLEAVDSSRSLLAIVLAGGEGLRLKRLTRTVCGDERPKQSLWAAGISPPWLPAVAASLS